jgi:undecaprenyl-diphosphatase
MDIIQSIVLGAVQGLTEFLPISSSGHLVLAQKFLKISEPPIFFDTLIHFATLIAVISYFRKDIVKIIKDIKQKETQKFLAIMLLATIPAVIAGFLIKDHIEQAFNSLKLVSISFLVTALILGVTKFYEKGQKYLKNITWLDAIFVGLFQALAILPGVSRSGSTISAGLFRHLKREDAFRFSFLLAIPVIAGAMVLQIFETDMSVVTINFLPNIAGFVTALIVGLLSLKILNIIMVKGKFHYFALYCLALGLITLFI